MVACFPGKWTLTRSIDTLTLSHETATRRPLLGCAWGPQVSQQAPAPLVNGGNCAHDFPDMRFLLMQKAR